MEASVDTEVRERGAGAPNSPSAAAQDGGYGLSLSGQSYWLDVWLMLLIDLVLLVFVYLLP